MVLLVALACGSPPPAIVLHGLLERALTLNQLHNHAITQYTHPSSTPIFTTRKKGNKSSWFREMIIISRKIKVASLNDVKLVLLYFCICVFVYMTFILSQCRMPEAITNQSLVHCHLVVDRPGNHRLYTLYICMYSTDVTLSSCIFMFNARMLL